MGSIWLSVDEFERLFAPAEHRAAEFEMRTLMARHIDRHATELAAGVEHMEGCGRPFAQDHTVIADRHGIGRGILHDNARDRLASGNVDHFGGRHGPDRGDGFEIAIPPGFIATRGESERHGRAPAAKVRRTPSSKAGLRRSIQAAAAP